MKPRFCRSQGKRYQIYKGHLRCLFVSEEILDFGKFIRSTFSPFSAIKVAVTPLGRLDPQAEADRT